MNEKVICEQTLCTGCGVCMNICPQKCIKMTENKEGFLYPQINERCCINCNLCSRKCPQNTYVKKMNADFYMAWHRDKAVVQKSSSGGVFTALATEVLDKNGLVVGAYLDNDTRNIEHIFVDNIKDLNKLRMSKYYQSSLNEIWSTIRLALSQKRQILFSGTACQVAALYSYLGENFDKSTLFTVDVLCHGVASKKIVSAYIDCKEKKYRKRVSHYHFRVKEGEKGWESGSGTRMKLFFEDGTSVVEEQERDTFFVGFNENLFLRESCYQCKYCGKNRISDFTIADFWGVTHERANEEQRKAGISVMTINTCKAKAMISRLQENLYMTTIDSSEVLPYNEAFSSPQKRPVERDVFFRVMEKKGYDTAVKRFMWKYYIKQDIKDVMRHVLPAKLYNRIIRTYKRCRRH